MPTRDQVQSLLWSGFDYEHAAQHLGISPGQAYMIVTGMAADGSDTATDEARRRGLLATSQHLSNPQPASPAAKDAVHAWIKARARADGQMQEAAWGRSAEPPEIEDPQDQQDAVSVLTRQHNQVKVLLKQLQALPSHTRGGSPGQLSARKSVVDLITVRLSQHETIEEEHLWPMVRSTLPDGDDWADGALAQEQEGKDTLTELGRLEADTREFDELAEKLIVLLRKHVSYEERVFRALQAMAPPGELERVGHKLASASKRAPTRPHKHAPKAPGPAVKAAAAGAAALDKARDAAGDRPAKREGT